MVDPQALFDEAARAGSEHLDPGTFSWLLEPMLDQAGFEIIEARYHSAKTHAAYLALRSPHRE